MSYALYNSSDVEKLLRELVPLQESIETTADAFLLLGENGFHKKLVEDWEAMFRHFHAQDLHVKRLALLYLANDVIQKAKTRVPKYLDSFKGSLCRTFRQLVDSKDEQNVQPALQLVELWKNRRIYSKEVAKEMIDILTDHSHESGKKEERDGGASEIPEGLIRVPQELIPFMDATRELDKWIKKTAEAEGKLKNVLRDSHFNEDEANLHLNEYKRCLELEQKYRTNLLKAQMELMRQLDTDHVKYTHLIKKVTGLIDDIENHF